jgi:hypothetical protein
MILYILTYFLGKVLLSEAHNGEEVDFCQNKGNVCILYQFCHIYSVSTSIFSIHEYSSLMNSVKQMGQTSGQAER